MMPRSDVTGPPENRLGWSSPSSPWFKVGLTLLIIFTIATFALASRLPIFTDEIGWKFMQARLGYDGSQSITTYPTCSTVAFDVPAILSPFRLIDTWIYQDISSPLILRFMGVAFALAWGGGAWLLLRRMLPSTVTSAILFILVAGFSTIGVMPFLLVTSRPEQIVLIGMTLFAIPLLADLQPRQRPLVADLALGILTAFFCGYFLTAHPRAIFALPLALLFVGRLVARKGIAVLAGLLVTIMGLTSLKNWAIRETCDDPAILDSYLKESIVFAAGEHRLPEYISQFWRAASQHPWAELYLTQFRLNGSYTSDMIPSTHSALVTPVSGVTFFAFALTFLTGAAVFVTLTIQAIRRRQITVPLLALAALWGFYLLSIFTRVTKNTYEEAVLEPIMVMIALGSLWTGRKMLAERFGAGRLQRVARLSIVALLSISILNQLTLLILYVPYASSSWSRPGYTLAQKFSISSVGYGQLRIAILKTASTCGIDPSRHPRHLIVDELTSFAMAAAYQPFLATYIDENGWGNRIGDIRGFLTKLGSDGMIVGCQWVPSKLRSEALQNGQFCCLPAFR